MQRWRNFNRSDLFDRKEWNVERRLRKLKELHMNNIRILELEKKKKRQEKQLRIFEKGQREVRSQGLDNKNLLYGTGNSVQCYVEAWTGGSPGENGYMCRYCLVSLLSIWNITTLLIDYTSIYFIFLCLVAQWYPIICNSMDCSPPSSYVHGISQTRILPTQRSNPCLPWLLHCRQILYHWATREAILQYKIKSLIKNKISHMA